MNGIGDCSNRGVGHCRDVTEVLHAFVDAEVDSVTERRVILHLAACSTCEAEWHAIEHLKSRLHDRCIEVEPHAIARLQTFVRELSDRPFDANYDELGR